MQRFEEKNYLGPGFRGMFNFMCPNLYIFVHFYCFVYTLWPHKGGNNLGFKLNTSDPCYSRWGMPYI